MKKVQRKKGLETMSNPTASKRPVAKTPQTVNLPNVKTVYLKKGTRWLSINKPESLDGFMVESYIEAANTLFVSKK